MKNHDSATNKGLCYTIKMKFIKPKRLAENNITAELYHRMRLLNLFCYLEYKVKGVGRFDMVVINIDEIICIIEVKSYSTHKPFNFKSKQMERYKSLKIPVLGCGRFEEINDTILAVKELLSEASKTTGQ